MRVLVAYMSRTGNTKKIAEAIYGEIGVEKDIMPFTEIADIGRYDLAFLGFPTHQYGPDKKTTEFLERTCTSSRKVALFVTHGAPETEPEVPQWMDKFKTAASGAELVGFFDCQGQLSKGTKLIMKMMSKKTREEARRDNSQGQPDATRIERAREFAKKVMSEHA